MKYRIEHTEDSIALTIVENDVEVPFHFPMLFPSVFQTMLELKDLMAQLGIPEDNQS